MRQDPFLPRLRAIADMFMMPENSVYDVYRRTSHDHIIYVFPRRDEWHVIIEPPVITTRDGTGPNFDGAMRVECPNLEGACGTAERVAMAARRMGRTAMIIADSVYTAQDYMAQDASSRVGGRA